MQTIKREIRTFAERDNIQRLLRELCKQVGEGGVTVGGVEIPFDEVSKLKLSLKRNGSGFDIHFKMTALAHGEDGGGEESGDPDADSCNGTLPVPQGEC